MQMRYVQVMAGACRGEASYPLQLDLQAGCEPPDMGAENQTQALPKNSMCFQTLSIAEPPLQPHK